jgi:hypothetical protein
LDRSTQGEASRQSVIKTNNIRFSKFLELLFKQTQLPQQAVTSQITDYVCALETQYCDKIQALKQ